MNAVAGRVESREGLVVVYTVTGHNYSYGDAGAAGSLDGRFEGVGASTLNLEKFLQRRDRVVAIVGSGFRPNYARRHWGPFAGPRPDRRPR